MPFESIEPEKLYVRDPNLKKEDVEIIQEWLKKQPHLPKITETQILIVLHSCHYKIEATKTCLDNYGTVRALCPDIFRALQPEVLKTIQPLVGCYILPKKTPQGYGILMLKLLELKTENFHCVEFLNLINMLVTIYVHQNGFDTGAVAIIDMKGFSFVHLGKLNVTAIKHALYFVQEAAPVRIKGIHVLNTTSLIDNLLVLFKPFLKKELFNMLQFHSPNSETLFKSVPKECLPEEYGGESPSTQVLNESNLTNLLDNYDFFAWHDTQVTDESKRVGKAKTVNDVFGMEGTFKKLQID